MRAVGLAVVTVIAWLAVGCASPPKPQVSKPPGVVVPGVVSSGLAGAGAATAEGSSGSGGSDSSGPAGSHGVVLLGGWAPGGAHNPVAAGARAYFRWLNARGGVFGRRVDYRVLNDRGSLRVVPSQVHRLVQGDAVFAVFGSAGIPGKAVTGFLDSLGVPDVFVGTGCSCVNAPTRLPQVFGWPLGDLREGKILGAYVARNLTGKKVAVLYRPSRSGRDALAGFTAAARGVKFASRVAVNSPSQAAAALHAAKAAVARVLVAFTSRDVTAKLAAEAKGLPLVAAGAGLADRLADGVITDGFLPSVAAPAKSAAGSWVALFRKIQARYLPHVALGPEVIDGMASAYEMAAAMFRAGPQLTRPGLISALSQMPAGPVATPLAYSATDHGGPQGAYVGVIRRGALVAGTGVLVTDTTRDGKVTAYEGAWEAAPSNGVPPH
jgi:ABC-type branched-subunit amino acid transport system substrate-binding protein